VESAEINYVRSPSQFCARSDAVIRCSIYCIVIQVDISYEVS